MHLKITILFVLMCSFRKCFYFSKMKNSWKAVNKIKYIVFALYHQFSRILFFAHAISFERGVWKCRKNGKILLFSPCMCIQQNAYFIVIPFNCKLVLTYLDILLQDFALYIVIFAVTKIKFFFTRSYYISKSFKRQTSNKILFLLN